MCLAGAKIQDVSERVNTFFSSNDEGVLIQVDNVQNESLDTKWSKHHELLCRLPSTRAKVVICSLLRTFDKNSNL